ncbi:YifB family Mg chelatase-like AAA ATPase [Janthinobacterium sp. 17J80-10]|uniref:YifB family Mg chelatase-like AAA ATPase n=1 Tax=Janthinobacterium sp. 17J80-10 TaxID=2497863 RepID=UPI001005301F|nr:YifB family Mg chelatase-like AAA ATPase [Janthinobacterium sp. 17J80-10]QAU33160.1 ATP-dependent protease [Janthinobacterium sp. 17J80-10]
MSLAVLKSRALTGMQAQEVTVEVHLANGLPSFTIVGLPDTEVKEARDRVRAALQNGRFEFPARRITVNLAPADLPKESGRFDLPIALGILAASGQIPADELDRYEFAGELSLSGELRPIRGALAMTYAMRNSSAAAGRQRAFILPQANAAEAALVMDAAILPATSLQQVCAHFAAPQGDDRLARHHAAAATQTALPRYPDFAEVKGQLHAKRALEVAAAGGHSILMVGPPGTGKSMLAARFPGILPPMSDEEALESAAVQSLTGVFAAANWKTRPFRAPHHTASGVALVGGGGNPRPGEISLAHRGVLFLDELPEFDRRVLEVLREPLESGHITISRAARQADFPARFQLVAAMNPCPCGYLGHSDNKCRCSPDMVARYQSRVSGPLLDRIDLQIQVASLPRDDLLRQADGVASAAIAARTEQAFVRQHARQDKANHALSPAEVDAWCCPDPDAQELLRNAMARLNWSARAYHRVLKVARTIADLASADVIGTAHVAEAIQYRRALQVQ